MPINKNSIATQSITIVPTGKIEYYVVSNKGGGIVFGLLGTLIEGALANDGNKITKLTLEQEVPQERVFQIGIEELQKGIKQQSDGQLIFVAERVLSDKPSEEWFKDEKREHLSKYPNLKSDLALEISFRSIGISKQFSAHNVGGEVDLRLVDIKTKKLLATSRNVIVFSEDADLLISIDENKPEYSAAVRRAISSLIKNLVAQASKNMFDISN